MIRLSKYVYSLHIRFSNLVSVTNIIIKLYKKLRLPDITISMIIYRFAYYNNMCMNSRNIIHNSLFMNSKSFSDVNLIYSLWIKSISKECKYRFFVCLRILLRDDCFRKSFEEYNGTSLIIDVSIL